MPDLIAPIVRIGEPAMQQQHRRAAAEGGVPDPDAVYRRIAALLRLWQARGRRQVQPLRLGARRRAARQERQYPEDYSGRANAHAVT